MRINVTVKAYGRIADFTAGMEINEPLIQAFEPIKTTDMPLLALFGDEKMPNSIGVQKIIMLREEAAKEISETLTKMLIDAMQKHDTYNGYTKENYEKEN